MAVIATIPELQPLQHFVAATFCRCKCMHVCSWKHRVTAAVVHLLATTLIYSWKKKEKETGRSFTAIKSALQRKKRRRKNNSLSGGFFLFCIWKTGGKCAAVACRLHGPKSFLFQLQIFVSGATESSCVSAKLILLLQNCFQFFLAAFSNVRLQLQMLHFLPRQYFAAAVVELLQRPPMIQAVPSERGEWLRLCLWCGSVLGKGYVYIFVTNEWLFLCESMNQLAVM